MTRTIPFIVALSRYLSSLAIAALLTACASEPLNRASTLPPAPTTSATHLQRLKLQLIAEMEAQQKWYAAISYLDAYRNRQSSLPDQYYLLRARALAATGHVAAARQNYRALAGTQLKAYGEQGLGLLDTQSGNQEGALRRFHQAVQTDPTNATMLNDLGYAYLLQRHFAQARNALFRAVQLAPDNHRAWSNIVVYLLTQRQDTQAQTVMTAQHMSAKARERAQQLAVRLRERPAAVATKQPTEAVVERSSQGMRALLQPPITELFSGKETNP